MNLKEIIEKRDTKAGRLFDSFIQLLIVLSLFSFAFETLTGLSDQMRRVLWYGQVFIVGVFTTEYLLRILVADRRLGKAREEIE